MSNSLDLNHNSNENLFIDLNYHNLQNITFNNSDFLFTDDSLNIGVNTIESHEKIQEIYLNNFEGISSHRKIQPLPEVHDCCYIYNLQPNARGNCYVNKVLPNVHDYYHTYKLQPSFIRQLNATIYFDYLLPVKSKYLDTTNKALFTLSPYVNYRNCCLRRVETIRSLHRRLY